MREKAVVKKSFSLNERSSGTLLFSFLLSEIRDM
jgi:hypothetical protein